MSIASKISKADKDIKKCNKNIADIVGSGFVEAETLSLAGKLHKCMRMMALENDDHNRKSLGDEDDPFPNDTKTIKMVDRTGAVLKDSKGNSKKKTIHGHYRLTELLSATPMPVKKSRVSTPATRPKRKAVVYEKEDDEDPASSHDASESESESEPKKPVAVKKPVVKKFTLDMGKEGMLVITATLRLVLWETFNVTEGCDDVPTKTEDIKLFLDKKISEEFKCNIYQFLVHVQQTYSLSTRDNMYDIDDIVVKVVQKYCGNKQVAKHISKLFAHFVKIVTISCSNMVWDNKTLRRINSKVFSVYRTLEIGFEHHKTISAGILSKLINFVKKTNERDLLKRTRAKLVKEQKTSDESVEPKTRPKKASKKPKTKSKKRQVVVESDSDPEPGSDDGVLSD